MLRDFRRGCENPPHGYKIGAYRFDSMPQRKYVKHGELAERSKAAVLKTVEGQPSGGSNPSLSAIFLNLHNADVSDSLIGKQKNANLLPIKTGNLYSFLVLILHFITTG